MIKTENYKLNKPEETDFYNIDDYNENVDIIDTVLDEHAKNTQALNTGLTAHTGNTTAHVTATEKATWNGKSNLTIGTTATTAMAGNTSIPTNTNQLTNNSGFVTSSNANIDKILNPPLWSNHYAGSVLTSPNGVQTLVWREIGEASSGRGHIKL